MPAPDAPRMVLYAMLEGTDEDTSPFIPGLIQGWGRQATQLRAPARFFWDTGADSYFVSKHL